MATKKIYLPFGQLTNTSPAPWDDNFLDNTDATSTGVLIADLLDDTSSPTGIGFNRVAAFTLAAGASGTITSDAGGWDKTVFDHYHYSNGSPQDQLTGLTNGDTYVIEVAGANQSTPVRNTDITIGGDTETYVSSGTPTPTAPVTLTGTVSGTTLDIDYALVVSFLYVNGLTIEITSVVGPTVTGPTSATEGVSVQLTGTDLDTATTAGFKSGSWSVSNTIDAQTATTLDLVPDLGTPTPTTPIASMPVTPTVTAAGITPHVLKSWVNDGVNPDGEFTLTTLSAGANDEVVQYMIATSNITEGQSVLAPSIMPTLEDDAQFIAPKTQNGVTYTWSADGTVETDKDQSETLSIVYFSLATGQRSLASVTVQGTSITGGGISIKSSIKSSIKRSIVR